MTIAETLMQFMYGGESLGTPEWLAVATEQMQTLNKGYHWGRYINCIEVNMTIFSAILLNQGKFFPSVSSLPKLPAFLPGYTKQVHSRLKNLDDSKSTKFKLSKKFSYNDWVTYLNKKSIPAYSYVILFAQIKKIGGGHVLSGFVTPKQNGDGVELQLFDAQGFYLINGSIHNK